MQVKQIVDSITKNEKKHKLFNLKSNNYSIWPYYRIYFYYSIGAKKGTFSQQLFKPQLSVNYLILMLRIFNLRKFFKKTKFLILEHPRANVKGFDIYTSDILAQLNSNECSLFSFSQKGVIDPLKRTIPLDFIKICSKICSKIYANFITSKYFQSNFESFLYEFSLNKNEVNEYIRDYKRYYIEFLIQLKFYKFLLKIKKVEVVYLTVYYTNMPLVVAAKTLNIKTVEVQHGVISKYHLGYHYPYYETDFFPDHTYLFGDFWKEAACYPKNSVIEVIGNSFLFFDKTATLNKEKNTILFVSQGTIGKMLKQYLLRNIESLNDFKVYFKLHPSEFNQAGLDYKEFINYQNVEIVSTQYNINSLQEVCEYQMGIYSTAIYEGLERGCKTLLLNDVGIEYMDYLISSKFVKLINFDDKIIDFLKGFQDKSKPCFFEEFRGEVI